MSDHESDDPRKQLWADIAQAAYELAVAEVDDDDQRASEARERSASAVGEAIRLGEPLSAIATHETDGRRRAREEFGKSLLKAAAASARRRRDAEDAFQRDVRRAGRLVSDREVAEAIGVAPGTVRAIVRRASATPDGNTDSEATDIEGRNEDGHVERG